MAVRTDTVMDLLKVCVRRAGGYAPLAREIGVTRQSVHGWATKGVPHSRLADLEAVAALYGVPVDSEKVERDAASSVASSTARYDHVAVRSTWWPDIMASIDRPVPRPVALADLRYHVLAMRSGGADWPSRSHLAARWGWTVGDVRTALGKDAFREWSPPDYLWPDHTALVRSRSRRGAK